MVEHAAGAGVESVAIPAYRILKNGVERSSEKMIMYHHCGAFVVPSSLPSALLGLNRRVVIS